MDETMNETKMENTEVKETETDVVPADTVYQTETENSGSDFATKFVAGVILAGAGFAGYVIGTKIVEPAGNFLKKKWTDHKERKATKKAEKQEPVCEGDATEVDDEEVEAEEATE